MPPPSFTLSLRALLTLPYRLCNPPPAAGNVRSCKVTPLIKVTLDDVLNKRHLPPLTLKDFEEWLVFVEGCPQYLYFLLWLKEYEARYATWLAESGCEVPHVPSPPKFASTTTLGSATPPASKISDSYINLIPPSAALALFFTRAKQTFLDPAPRAPYALGPDALAALAAAHTPSTHSFSPSIPQFTMPPLNPREESVLPAALASHPHPHPRELAPLAQYARQTLKERLERFAAGACHNVGTRRAWCGVAGGTVITLLFGILPTLIALFWAHTRWWRLVGFFGCWLGGTVVVSSFHGICMMIYVFGDLRQLRSFELARPTISPPRAIARARPRLRSFFTRTPDASAETSESASTPVPTPRDAPPVPHLQIPPAHDKEKAWASVSETSTGTPVVRFDPAAFVASEVTTLHIAVGASSGTGTGTGTEEEGGCGIEISPAYYPEGMGPAASQRATALASVRSAVGRVLTWMRAVSASPGGGEEAQSHAGTFGVRGGLGSLSGGAGEDDGRAGDLEKGAWTATDAGETDAEVLTAEFIPREYRAPSVDAVDAARAVVREKEKEKQKEAPVQFDFDKLPSAAPQSRPVSMSVSPSVAEPPRTHSRSYSHTRTHSSPHIPPTTPLPPPLARAPLSPPPAMPLPPLPSPTHLAPPPPALYVHPGAHVISPSPSPSPPPPSPIPKDRQWWDTCPQHPAVAATLSPTPSPAHTRASTPRPAPSEHSRAGLSWRARLRHVTGVPAFGPLTRVLSPVVARGQWEVVVRSAGVAALGAWVVVGCFVALPEVR